MSRIIVNAQTGAVEIDNSFVQTVVEAPAKPLGALSRRQLRLGLLSIGIKSADVEAKIEDLPEDQREIAMIDWQDASEYERTHPLVSMLGASFGLTDEQIDEAWLAAQEL